MTELEGLLRVDICLPPPLDGSDDSMSLADFATAAGTPPPAPSHDNLLLYKSPQSDYNAMPFAGLLVTPDVATATTVVTVVTVTGRHDGDAYYSPTLPLSSVMNPSDASKYALGRLSEVLKEKYGSAGRGSRSKLRTPRTLTRLMQQHRDSERHRHRGLNATIKEISKRIPGFEDANNETKIVKLQRIINYICHLERHIVQLCEEQGLDLELKNLFLLPNLPKVNEIKRTKWKSSTTCRLSPTGTPTATKSRVKRRMKFTSAPPVLPPTHAKSQLMFVTVPNTILINNVANSKKAGTTSPTAQGDVTDTPVSAGIWLGTNNTPIYDTSISTTDQFLLHYESSGAMGTVGAMEEVGEEVGAVSLEGGAVDTFHSYAKTASPASTGLTDLIDKCGLQPAVPVCPDDEVAVSWPPERATGLLVSDMTQTDSPHATLHSACPQPNCTTHSEGDVQWEAEAAATAEDTEPPADETPADTNSGVRSEKATPPPKAKGRIDHRKTSWMNGFMMFSQLHRKLYIEENPGMHTSHISKLMGYDWRHFTSSQQQPYRDKAKLYIKQFLSHADNS